MLTSPLTNPAHIGGSGGVVVQDCDCCYAPERNMAAFTDWGAPLRIDRRYDNVRHNQHDQGIASRRLAITIVCGFVCGMSRSTASVAKRVSIARS